MKSRTQLEVVCSLAAVLLIGVSSAAAQPEATLHKCQQTAGKEVGKYADAVHDTVIKCLNRISSARIGDAAGDAADAAGGCAAAFRKLVNTEDSTKTLDSKALTKIKAICDPAAPGSQAEHTAADVLGAGATVLGDAIEADDLGAWCAQVGGDGTVSSVHEWVDCQLTVAASHAAKQSASEYPNVLAWLADVRGDILALGPEQKYIDAVGALDLLVSVLDGNDDGVLDLAGGSLPATGQTISFGSGSDGDLELGVPRSFTDNGDGTITDNATGLMWEKKHNTGGVIADCIDETTDTCGNPHDVDNRYEWCADDAPENGGCDNAGDPFDGPVVSIFLNQLNNRCNDDVTVVCTTDSDCSVPGGPCGFAGYRDWRLPNLFELESIRSMSVTSTPSIHAAFNTGCAASCTLATAGSCSCTTASNYWTSTTHSLGAGGAWFVSFSVGLSTQGNKPFGIFARAVRGGL